MRSEETKKIGTEGRAPPEVSYKRIIRPAFTIPRARASTMLSRKTCAFIEPEAVPRQVIFVCADCFQFDRNCYRLFSLRARDARVPVAAPGFYGNFSFSSLNANVFYLSRWLQFSATTMSVDLQYLQVLCVRRNAFQREFFLRERILYCEKNLLWDLLWSWCLCLSSSLGSFSYL